MLFFFWLPFYLQNELHYSNDISALLSTWFDVGSIIGGALAGSLTDVLLKKAHMDRSFVLILAILLSAGQLYLYFTYASVSLGVNITLMVTTGIMIGGPNSIMNSAVAADLNEHPTLKGNTEALGTIAGVIDGIASIVAAAGQFAVAAISSKYGWGAVFIFFDGLNCGRGSDVDPSGMAGIEKKTRVVVATGKTTFNRFIGRI